MVQARIHHSMSRIPSSYHGRMLTSRKKGTPRKILATIVVAFFLISPIFVSGSAKGILSLSANIDSISTLHESEIPSLLEVIKVSRGGAINRKGKGGLYLKALDDEILWLQQQLRRVEQEKRNLKKKLSNRQRTRESAMEPKNKSNQKGGRAGKSIEKHEEDLLRLANLEQLEKQKDSLLTAKAQLESIKLDYEQKLQALELDLSKSKRRSTNLEKTFLSRVKELESSLKKVRDAAANTKSNSDPELTRKINDACQIAISDFWIEGNRKLQEHEQQLKAKYEQEIAEERRLAALAVEKQRQKMRALARATAIREKEIFAKKKGQTPPSSRKADEVEKLEREKIKSLRQEAERKAKEEEERMWLELERELKEERERLQRMKQRDEDEKRRCEQEEMERRRLLQQHALDLEERLRKEQQQAASGDLGGSSGTSLFGRLFGTRKKGDSIPEPTIASIENYQRRVMWQPITLPPREAIKIKGPSIIE